MGEIVPLAAAGAAAHRGLWLSLVERLVRDEEAVGSNPTSPIKRTWLGMNETVLTTIAFTGFTVAFFHAAIPTHWLPFVAAGRAQQWTHSKTLLITALAGPPMPSRLRSSVYSEPFLESPPLRALAPASR